MGADEQGRIACNMMDLEAYIVSFKDRLIRAAHESISAGLGKTGYHRPRDCPKRQVRQDPPVCPKCSPLLRTFIELDEKLKEEIWDTHAHICNPALDEAIKLYRRILSAHFQLV